MLTIYFFKRHYSKRIYKSWYESNDESFSFRVFFCSRLIPNFIHTFFQNVEHSFNINLFFAHNTHREKKRWITSFLCRIYIDDCLKAYWLNMMENGTNGSFTAFSFTWKCRKEEEEKKNTEKNIDIHANEIEIERDCIGFFVQQILFRA